ncbi:hypothetical protein ACP275_04G125600 [Erythranthe tilingii]
MFLSILPLQVSADNKPHFYRDHLASTRGAHREYGGHAMRDHLTRPQCIARITSSRREKLPVGLDHDGPTWYLLLPFYYNGTTNPWGHVCKFRSNANLHEFPWPKQSLINIIFSKK